MREKYFQYIKREDTNSVEIWGPGSQGRECVKIVKGPLFYKGKFYVDEQLFIDDIAAISGETIADFFDGQDISDQ